MSPALPVVFVVGGATLMRWALPVLADKTGWRAEAFGSARAFLSSSRASAPCCLVLDVLDPSCSGLLYDERLAAERAGTPIICIAEYGDVPMAVRAMRAGAVDVLSQPLGPDALLEAVRFGLGRSERGMQREAEARELQDRYASLSTRERQVMTLVASGLLNKQVGGELGISEITVKIHRGKMMRKMKASSFAHLVRIAATLDIANASISG